MKQRMSVIPLMIRRIGWPLCLVAAGWAWSQDLPGRPILSLTFALNYCLIGPSPFGFHVILREP